MESSTMSNDTEELFFDTREEMLDYFRAFEFAEVSERVWRSRTRVATIRLNYLDGRYYVVSVDR
jgi:hypothetical protein